MVVLWLYCTLQQLLVCLWRPQALRHSVRVFSLAQFAICLLNQTLTTRITHHHDVIIDTLTLDKLVEVIFVEHVVVWCRSLESSFWSLNNIGANMLGLPCHPLILWYLLLLMFVFYRWPFKCTGPLLSRSRFTSTHGRWCWSCRLVMVRWCLLCSALKHVWILLLQFSIFRI